MSTVRSRGITLVEAMVATMVLLLISGAIVTILSQTQQTYTGQHDLVTAAQSARTAMSQIQSFFRQAGNDPGSPGPPRVDPIGFTPIQIVSASEVLIFSDVTGSVTQGPNATGGPDADLNSRYEQVRIRYDNPTDRLFIDINDDGNPANDQILASGVVDFQVTYLDLTGNPTADGNEIARVKIRIEVATGSPDPQTGKVTTISLESDVMVRSKSYGLFDTS